MEVPCTALIHVLVGILYIQVTKATICYETNDNFGFTQTVIIYCGEDEVCCGDQRNRECCEDDVEDIIGVIIGCVLGLVVFVIVVVVIVCLVKQCNKTSQKGAVINPYPVTSAGVGAVGNQPQPYYSGPPAIRQQPLNNFFTVQPTTSEPNDIPPPFVYIPP
ncbi:uncharacterized protein [Argopecten irradians]|uniref:uncharacterized protein n=1 Tax=Argopecten irradians TaxID=31199 RepID=UPI00371983A9